MGERLKELRKVLGLTQQEFADRLRIKRNTIAKYETNRGEPVDAVFALIAREFNVNETWLRTGEGEMFVPVSRDEQIAAFIGGMLADGGSFKHRFISMLSRLDENEWEVLERMALEMAEKEKKD